MRTPGSSGSNQPTHGSRVYANQLKTFRDVEIAFRLLEMELAKKQKVTEVTEAPITNITQNVVQNYTVLGGLITIGIHSVLSTGLTMAWPIRLEFPTGQFRNIIRASISLNVPPAGSSAIVDIRIGKNATLPWLTPFTIFSTSECLTIPVGTRVVTVTDVNKFNSDAQNLQTGWFIGVSVIQAGSQYGGGEGSFISLLLE